MARAGGQAGVLSVGQGAKDVPTQSGGLELLLGGIGREAWESGCHTEGSHKGSGCLGLEFDVPETHPGPSVEDRTGGPAGDEPLCVPTSQAHP